MTSTLVCLAIVLITPINVNTTFELWPLFVGLIIGFIHLGVTCLYIWFPSLYVCVCVNVVCIVIYWPYLLLYQYPQYLKIERGKYDTIG